MQKIKAKQFQLKKKKNKKHTSYISSVVED